MIYYNNNLVIMIESFKDEASQQRFLKVRINNRIEQFCNDVE